MDAINKQWRKNNGCKGAVQGITLEVSFSENFCKKIWKLQIKSVTLPPKGTNSLCNDKMKTQVMDENWNVLAEYEAKISSRPRARLVRVKNIEYFGPVPKSQVMPANAVFPNF